MKFMKEQNIFSQLSNLKNTDFTENCAWLVTSIYLCFT